MDAKPEQEPQSDTSSKQMQRGGGVGGGGGGAAAAAGGAGAGAGGVSPKLERERNTKADSHPVSPGAELQEREIPLESAGKINDKKSSEANSKNKQQEVNSGRPVDFRESSRGSQSIQEQNKLPGKVPQVRWRNTVQAEKKLRDIEKAAQLERRVGLIAMKPIRADEPNKRKGLSPELERISSSAYDTPSKEQQTIPESEKSAKASDTPSLKPETIPESKQSLKETRGTSGGNFQEQIPIIQLRAGPQSKATELKDIKSSQSEDEGHSRRSHHLDETRGKGTYLNIPIHKKSSSVAAASIEEEILERTDPDLEEAIIRSIAFSFRFTEAQEIEEALADGELQKLKEEAQEAAAAEQELVCEPSAISLTVSGESDTTKEGEVRKQSVMDRLLRFVEDALSASVKSKHCMQIYRSAFAIRKEKKRQRMVNRFVIHPYSEFRIAWDIMVVIALVLTLLALPVEIAFYSVDEERGTGETENLGLTTTFATSATATTATNVRQILQGFVHYENSYEAINLFAEAIFILDIIINFRTGYVFRDTDQVILSSKDIAWHYLRTWFIFDFISAAPFDKIYEAFPGHGKDRSKYLQIRFLRLAKILALLRAFTVFRLLRYIHHLEIIFVLQQNLVVIGNLIGVTLLFAHWNACLQYMACFTEHYPNFPPDSWISKDQLQWNNVTVLRRYTRSLIRALSHTLAVGYGQSPPTATSETWVVLVSMMVGCTFYALFIPYMAALLRSLDYSGAKHSEQVDCLKEFMRFHKIPARVQRRVLRFFDQKYRRKFFDSEVYFKTSILSPTFQEILSMHNCRRMVESVSFFQNASRQFIYAIVSRLEFQVFYPGEFILHAGSREQSLLLVAHGKVEVFSKAVLLEKIYDGGYYGEVSLILNEVQQFDVIAADVSDIYLLTKAGFDEVLAEFSEIRDALRQIAAVRLQRQSTRIDLFK